MPPATGRLATALLDETCAQLGMLLEGMTQLRGGPDRPAGRHRHALSRLARFSLVTPKADAP